MEQVELAGGTYCMTEQSAKNVLVNLEKYVGALDKCNNIINLYNNSIKDTP